MASSAVARYEIVKNAAERRRPLWAASLSSAVRIEGASREEVRQLVESELQQLLAEGSVYLFRVPRFWGSEEPILEKEVKEVLSEEKNWRPRSTSVAQVPRIGLTARGSEKLRSGEFGVAAPVAWTPNWFVDEFRSPHDLENTGHLLHAVAGAVLGIVAYGILTGYGLVPPVAAALQKVLPNGVGILIFAFGGIALGSALWHIKSKETAPEWVFDANIPVRSKDDFGDTRF